jgi:hypothetical protein
MKKLLSRFALVATVIVAMAAITAGAAVADQSYSDGSGDAGVGTDITNMTVRNDQSGLITIQIASANNIVGNHAIALFIDADKNQATGGQGDEYWMYGGPLVGAGFFSWSGSGFSPTNPPSFRARAASPNVTEFAFNRSDIGNVTGFNFVAISISIDGDNINFWDSAPNTGSYTYDLAFPQCSNGKDDDGDGNIDAADLGCSGTTDENEADDPVNIKVGKAKVAPLRPKAGKQVVVSAPTTRVETGQPLDAATVKCAAKVVGGAAMKGTGSLVGGRAVCKFKVPLTAKNKVVRGTIAVTYQTASAKTPFTFRTAA